MVIDKNPNSERIKEFEQVLAKTDDERKIELLTKLLDESVSIIALAYMYAKNLEEIGEDVTTRWQTMEQQNRGLKAAYDKGYIEGIDKGKELEREFIKKGRIIHKPDIVNDTDRNIRQNQVSGSLRNVVQPTDVKHRRKSTKKRHKR